MSLNHVPWVYTSCSTLTSKWKRSYKYVRNRFAARYGNKERKRRHNIVVDKDCISCEQDSTLPFICLWKMSKKSDITVNLLLVLLRQEFLIQWKTSGMLRIVFPATLVAFHRHTSDDATSRSQQGWDQVTAEATQLYPFVLCIKLGNGCLNTEWHREKNGQELHMQCPHRLRCCQWHVIQ